jgi:hypothetical protein
LQEANGNSLSKDDFITLLNLVFAMNSTRSFLVAIFAIALLIARAPACGAGDEVKVTVVAVLATSKNKNVDAKCACLAREVQKKEPNLTGFQIKRCTCKELAVGDQFKFPLVDDQVMEVSIQRGKGKDDRIGLTAKPPLGGEIVYDSCCGKFFPLMTRYQTKNGEQLIIAIRVQCCK